MQNNGPASALRRQAKLITTCAVVMAATACVSDASLDAENVIGGRLETGYESAIYLTMVDQVRPFCSGVVIGEQLVLTAAHCFYEDEDQDGVLDRITDEDLEKVRIGVGQLADAHRFSIKTLMLHPAHDPNATSMLPNAYDLALLFTDEPMVDAVGEAIVPAVIASPDFDSEVTSPQVSSCHAHRLVGYGRTKYQGSGLRKSAQFCMTPSQLVLQQGGVAQPWGALNYQARYSWDNSAPGDSGGPFFIEGTNQVVGLLVGLENQFFAYGLSGRLDLHAELIQRALDAQSEDDPIAAMAPGRWSLTCRDDSRCISALYGGTDQQMIGSGQATESTELSLDAVADVLAFTGPYAVLAETPGDSFAARVAVLDPLVWSAAPQSADELSINADGDNHTHEIVCFDQECVAVAGVANLRLAPPPYGRWYPRCTRFPVRVHEYLAASLRLVALGEPGPGGTVDVAMVDRYGWHIVARDQAASSLCPGVM